MVVEMIFTLLSPAMLSEQPSHYSVQFSILIQTLITFRIETENELHDLHRQSKHALEKLGWASGGAVSDKLV